MNMKKYAMILVAISMSFVSCEKWLDLQQEGEITASQLYLSLIHISEPTRP